MIPAPRHLPKARVVEAPASVGWGVVAMTALYLVSLGVVGITAFVGAVRWYVAGFGHLPLWIGLGPLALTTGTLAAIWLAQH